MIPVRLKLRNFMCYRDDVEPLDFSGIHVAALCGNNGAGKSALLDAITWSLWGQARAKSDDELISIGQREMEVEYEFYAGPDKYRVIRKRSQSKSGATSSTLLELQQEHNGDYRTITGNTLRETQRKLIDILRLDYQTFINSAYLLQGRADEFTVKLPSERKKVLAEILGLSFYDELERRARDQSRRCRDELNRLESATAEIDRELGKKDEYKAQAEQINESLNIIDVEVAAREKEVNDLRRMRHSLDFKEEQLQDISRRLLQADRQLAEVNAQITENGQRRQKHEAVIDRFKDETAELDVELNRTDQNEKAIKSKKERQQELLSSVHHLKSINLKLKEEMSGLKSKIDMLGQEGAFCPLCGTELGREGHEHIVENYQSQGEEKGNQYRQNETEIKQYENDLRSLNADIASLESRLKGDRVLLVRKREALVRDYNEAQQQLPLIKKSISRAEEVAVGLKVTIDEDSKSKAELLQQLNQLPYLDSQLRHAEDSYSLLQSKQMDAREKLIVFKEKIRRCDELEEARKEKQESYKTTSAEKGIYDDLSLAFGKKGVQALIIEAALPELESEANRLLATMTESRMNIRLETQRAKKTKKDEIEETLDIKISDEMGIRNYEMYSGGEAFRINFALRIALSKLLAHRHGAPLPTLIIDEGFGTQDNTGMERIVEAIKSIKDDFAKIIVITHIDELKDAFETRIQVTKTGHGSLVEMVQF